MTSQRRPIKMTTETILEAKKLLAEFRDVLTVLGTIEKERLGGFVLEKMLPMFNRLQQQFKPLERQEIFGSEKVFGSWYEDASIILNLADAAQLRPILAEKLPAEIATRAPRAVAVLDKVIARLEPAAH